MIKTSSVLFLVLGGIPEGGRSKGLETHSNKLRPTVSLPRKVVDTFEKIFFWNYQKASTTGTDILALLF